MCTKLSLKTINIILCNKLWDILPLLPDNILLKYNISQNEIEQIKCLINK